MVHLVHGSVPVQDSGCGQDIGAVLMLPPWTWRYGGSGQQWKQRHCIFLGVAVRKPDALDARLLQSVVVPAVKLVRTSRGKIDLQFRQASARFDSGSPFSAGIALAAESNTM